VVTDLRIVGANRLGEVAAQLKAAGDRELRRDLLRGIQRAGKPLKAAAREGALRNLPSTGGLNEFVADAKVSVRTRSAGRNPGVRLTGKKSGHDLQAIDRGRVRHPVFGNRRAWVNQSVRAGWWTEALQDAAPKVRQELVEVVEDIARRVTR
jgi:hypothetical protein